VRRSRPAQEEVALNRGASIDATTNRTGSVDYTVSIDVWLVWIFCGSSLLLPPTYSALPCFGLCHDPLRTMRVMSGAGSWRPTLGPSLP
jgi:hypothetical protein